MKPPKKDRDTQWDEPFNVRPDVILPNQIQSINDAILQLGQELGGGRTIKEERIPVNQLIDEPAAVRKEGNVIIIPIMKEHMVLTKKLILVEEIRLSTEDAQESF